jgi:hypothetical protein
VNEARKRFLGRAGTRFANARSMLKAVDVVDDGACKGVQRETGRLGPGPASEECLQSVCSMCVVGKWRRMDVWGGVGATTHANPALFTGFSLCVVPAVLWGAGKVDLTAWTAMYMSVFNYDHRCEEDAKLLFWESTYRYKARVVRKSTPPQPSSTPLVEYMVVPHGPGCC